MELKTENIESESAEYQVFVEKFKPKKTTDDCYTPPLIYETVKNWACEKYGIDPEKIVRPFYPGGDYEHFDYSNGAVVLDNPPFSIISKICTFYLDRDIPFFLFAPSLTAFSARSATMRTNHIICDAGIVYENGAVVKTSFVTSFGGDVIAQTAPDLSRAVNNAVEKICREQTRELPKYTYPYHVLTATMLQKYSHYGIDFSVKRGECEFISALDVQRESKKTIFGGGLLLSERMAAERMAAERMAEERENAIVWELSERERAIIAGLK